LKYTRKNRRPRKMSHKQIFVNREIFKTYNMCFRQFKYLINHQKWLTMQQDIHELDSIIQGLSMDIKHVCFISVFIFTYLIFNTFGKSHICCMPRTSGHDMTFEWAAYQSKIANHIQQFVPSRLVLIT